VTTSDYILADAIRQVEHAMAQGERLATAVQWISREYGLEPSLLTRRWVQFTPSPKQAERSTMPDLRFGVVYSGSAYGRTGK